MSQWDKKYVSTNVKEGSQPYDKGAFLGFQSELVSSQPELKDVAYILIVRRFSPSCHFNRLEKQLTIEGGSMLCSWPCGCCWPVLR